MKTRFNLIFEDKDLFGDWYITLVTTEPKTEEEINLLVLDFIDICNATKDDYSPVDIMDLLVDTINMDGERNWHWQDWDYDVIEIEDWR